MAAFAQVSWSSPTCPGNDIPADDPPGTVRAAWLRLLALLVRPGVDAAALRARYWVPVTVVADFPAHVDPRRRMIGRILDIGMPMDSAESVAAWLDIAESCGRNLRAGMTPTDAAAALFDADPRLTYTKGQRFVAAVVDEFVPDTADYADGRIASRPILAAEVRARRGLLWG